jgi:hypothetical protein
MGMRGQSDYSSDYTGNITLSTEGGANASECVINISNTDYDGIKAGTSKNTGAVMITVPSGTKYLHIHAAAWNGTTCSLTVTPEGYSDAIALTANSGIANNPPFTFYGDASTSDYYKVITFSNALTSATYLTFTATGGKRFVIWGVTSEEEGSPALVAIPTFNPASGTEFGSDGLQVTISCETTGARIYYTLDGSTPDDGSNYYQSAINLTETTTIKAIAYDNDDNTSSVATATYTYVDPNAPGTENNPYTVAQARAAIDANAGTQGVYATGIVSAIVTAYDAGFHNVTFNMVDEAGDEVFLQAYRCGGDEAANVAVGDVVVVYGNLTYHAASGTYEFGQGCEVVSLTHPVITTPVVTVTPNTIDAPAEGADGTLALTYENITDFISFDYYFCDADGNELEDTDPDYPGDWIFAEINEPGEEENHTLSYIIDANDGEARTAYMKVYTLDDEAEEVYAIVTVNQAAYEAPNVTWDLSIASYDEITDSDIVTWSSEYATMTNSSKSGGTSASNYLGGDSNNRTSSRFYSGNTLTISPEVGYAIVSVVFTATSNNYADALVNSEWTNATASAEGTTVTVTPISGASAIQAVIGGTCGFTQVKVYYEQHEAQYYDLTISLNENIPFIFVFDADDQNDPLIEDGEAGTVQVLEGTSIMVSPDVAEGYVLETLLVNDENVVSQLDESGAYTFTMPAENVTISATAVEYVAPAPFAPTVYTKATSITSGAHYIIVGFNGSDAYAMGAQNNNNRGSVIVSENGTIATVVNENVYDFVVEAVEGTNFYSIYDERNSGYLYAASSSSNHLKTQAENNNNGYWDIDFENLEITAQGQNTRNKMRFNYNNGNPIFSCYGSGQQPVYLYVKSDETPANNEITIEGTDFGTAEAPTNAGYKLIASPFNNVNPQDVAGMLAGNYDLYYFDENGMDDGELKEWRNYKTSSFLFKSGKGYLYASENGATLNFIGAPYAGEGEVGLDYTEGNRFAGFNLIGNPFNTNATLVDMPYYRLNENGSALNTSTESSQINVMEGVFVQATAENTTAHFTTAAGSKIISQLNVKVTRNRGAVLDNAIIRFDNGAMLGKFQLNPNSTKVYITEGNEDYAIVRSAAESEMPVSFKAAENGTYTLSVVAENVEMNYLHLIDNMTGTDVDLLATPSYSFEANTTDYANRFRLVFNANGLEENSNFAFFNGSEWVVSNMGDATLQVIDMTGRVISSETVNGNVTFSTNGLTAGVYMMRLVNGNDVKTQKVLVK